MERDIFMSATEAQAYGIVDFVAVQGKEHGFHGTTRGFCGTW